MAGIIRKSIHRFIPAHFEDPFGLTIRLIRSRDSAALFALCTAILSVAALPVDVILEIFERKLYLKSGEESRRPLIFVTGPARSGTSLMTQVLIQNLPVSYINNLTAVFQRSPITANILFKGVLSKPKQEYKSYYGKTTNFNGPNDGLHIWDRWLGKDRTKIPTHIDEKSKRNMIQFFSAFEKICNKTLVNKNNNLNICADLIAETLKNSYFICLTRNPIFLAQSLLKARLEIHSDPHIPYGIQDPEHSYEYLKKSDFVADVCRQVLFHAKIIREQQEKIGEERFWVIPYEEFCRKPAEVVINVAQKILDYNIDEAQLRKTLPSFKSANIIQIQHKIFKQIEDILNSLENCI